MKTSVRTLEDNRVELTVELSEDKVSAAMDEEYQELAASVKVPGFRQGKVPREVLERRFTPEAMIHKVIEKLVPPTYPAAIEAHDLRPIEMPDVQVDEYEGGPLTYRATFEVQPEAEIDGYIGIEITVPPIDVTDEEVEEQVDRLRDRLSKLELIEDRTAEQGDFLLIDFAGYLDEVAFEGGSGSDFLLEIGSGRFLPGIEDGLIGAEKGETKEIWIDVPEDYHGTEIAGKKVRFDVTVKEIKAKTRPEADDAFAAEASEFDTIAELRDNLREQLRVAKTRAVEVKGQSQILDWLETHVEVEAPQKMIDAKHEQLLGEFLDMIQSQGLTLDEYFRVTESNQDVLKASMESEATKRVREELALDAIARKENIVVPEPEVEEEIVEWSRQSGQDPAEVRARMEDRGNMADVRAAVRRRRTLEWLSQRVTPVIKELDDEADESSSDSDAEGSAAPEAEITEGTGEQTPEGTEEESPEEATEEG